MSKLQAKLVLSYAVVSPDASCDSVPRQREASVCMQGCAAYRLKVNPLPASGWFLLSHAYLQSVLVTTELQHETCMIKYLSVLHVVLSRLIID